MLRGSLSITSTGMPITHGRAFQRVVDYHQCAIAVRAVDHYATGLLLESYATKGFHNKAKSCTWGPMAGFVLADPRFTKNPDMQGQRKHLRNAVHSGAGEIPLYITDSRRQALESDLKCMMLVRGDRREMLYTASSPTGLSMHFVLKHTTDAPGANGQGLWAVFHAPGESRLSNNLAGKNNNHGKAELLPVMAIIDPLCPPEIRDSYRAATTCDYDLWSVSPRRSHYSYSGHDRRAVPDSHRLRQGIKLYINSEDPHLGNITPRIAALRIAINTAVRAEGYQGGDVVHHSDEAGRPLVSTIDFPCVFFIPHKEAVYVNNVNDLKQVIRLLSFDYVLGLNPGWFRQLGIDVSMKGHYELGH